MPIAIPTLEPDDSSGVVEEDAEDAEDVDVSSVWEPDNYSMTIGRGWWWQTVALLTEDILILDNLIDAEAQAGQ